MSTVIRYTVRAVLLLVILGSLTVFLMAVPRASGVVLLLAVVALGGSLASVILTGPDDEYTAK